MIVSHTKDPSKRFTCTVCGTQFNWGPGCWWFGCYADGADAFLCSNRCKKKYKTIVVFDSEEEYQESLKRIEELQDAEEHTLEGEELESLSFAVGKYEEEHQKLPEPTLKDHVQFGIEQFGLRIELEMKGCKSTILYSIEDNCYHGKLEGIDDLILFEGQTVDEAILAFIEAIEDYKELKKEL